MPNSRKISILTLSVITGIAVALIYHKTMASQFGKGWPENSFLFMPGERFGDLVNILQPGFRSIYFPFAFYLTYPLTLVTPLVAVFLQALIYGVTAFLFLGVSARNLKRESLKINPALAGLFSSALTIFSYPALFALDRANTELLLFALIATWLSTYLREDRGCVYRWVSRIALAAAIASKLFPCVFLVLYIARGRFRSLLWIVGVVALMTMLPLWLNQVSLSAHYAQWQANVSKYRDMYAIDQAGVAFNSSLFGLFRILLYWAQGLWSGTPLGIREISAPLAGPYQIMVIALFGLFVFPILTNKVRFWQMVTLLTTAMVLLPEVSSDYKLIHFLLPIGLFVNARHLNRFDWLFAGCFAVLLVPKAYGMLIPHPMFPTTLSPVVSPLAQCLLAAAILIPAYSRRKLVQSPFVSGS